MGKTIIESYLHHFSQGDKVMYTQVIDHSDSFTTYTIIEIDVPKNWCKIQADVNMNIKPTYTANLSDLKVA